MRASEELETAGASSGGAPGGNHIPVHDLDPADRALFSLCRVQQCPHKSAAAVCVNVCSTLIFASSFPHFKQSEEKELESLAHLPSIGDLTCVLQTGSVPGFLLTEK